MQCRRQCSHVIIIIVLIDNYVIGYGYAVEADSAEVEYQQNYQQEDDPEYQQDILEDQQDNAEYQQKRYDPIADQAQDDATQDDNAKIQHASRCCNGRECSTLNNRNNHIHHCYRVHVAVPTY